MTSIRDIYKNKWMKVSDLDGSERELTVSRTAPELVGNPPEEKLTVNFREDVPPLILNVTNAKAIAAMHGENYDEWDGKKVTLFCTQASYGSEMHDVIRVKQVDQKRRLF